MFDGIANLIKHRESVNACAAFLGYENFNGYQDTTRKSQCQWKQQFFLCLRKLFGNCSLLWLVIAGRVFYFRNFNLQLFDCIFYTLLVLLIDRFTAGVICLSIQELVTIPLVEAAVIQILQFLALLTHTVHLR